MQDCGGGLETLNGGSCCAFTSCTIIELIKYFVCCFLQIKHWERIKCKPNSLPIVHKMHVKIGDTVKVIAGRDKGKIGEITKIIKHNSTVVVSEVNVKTKHAKSKEQGEPGQILKVLFPPTALACLVYKSPTVNAGFLYIVFVHFFFSFYRLKHLFIAQM